MSKRKRKVAKAPLVEDEWFDWRPKNAPLKTCEGREVVEDQGRRGGRRFRNKQGGDLEPLRLAERINDDQYKAGVRVRSLLEKAMGGGQSPLGRAIDQAKLGIAASLSPHWGHCMGAARADALTELGKLHCKVGISAWQVVLLFLVDGMALREIDRRRRWRNGRSADYLRSALDDAAIYFSNRGDYGDTRACARGQLRAQSSYADVGAPA